MKVLHIGKYFPPCVGGMENYLRDLAVALVRQGVTSPVLVHHDLQAWRSSHESYAAGSARVAVTRAATPARLVFAPVSPVFPWQLHLALKRCQPDILHLHMPNPSVFWALLLPAARSIPWVVHWHADVPPQAAHRGLRYLYPIYRRLQSLVLRRSKAIVATSPAYLASSEPLAQFRDKCTVIPLGLDPQRLAPMPACSLAAADAPLKVIVVARLSYYKGLGYLLQALSLVEGVELHLVGEGEEGLALRAQVTALQLQDRVHFHGQLPAATLAQVFADCDCLCLPSIERSEAFGLVLLEAMYFAKASIVSDVPGSGMGWVVQDGQQGLHAVPASAESLASRLRELRDDRELSSSLGKRGRERFDQLFHIDRTALEVIELYRSVLMQNRGQRQGVT